MSEYKFGQFNQLENLWLQFHNHAKGQWIMKIDMAIKLFELIEKYKPTQVLELGTGIGCATAVIAAALDNARIMTVEQNPKMTELAKELIPQLLKQKIQFETRPVAPMTIPEIDPLQAWSAFVNFPWAKWDFIVIDGPGPFMLNNFPFRYPDGTKKIVEEFLADLPNGDIINLIPKMAPGTLVFLQGRVNARKLYKRYLGWYLEVIDGDMEQGKWCLFKRTNQPLKEDFSDFRNSDETRGNLIQSGYFE